MTTPAERGGRPGAQGVDRRDSTNEDRPAPTASTPSTFRSRPRRRGEALETAILTAAAEELREVGYSAMTIESVAARAGAGKVSIYRRWPSKVELAVDAGYRLAGEVSWPEEPSTVRADLLALFRHVAAQMAGPAGAALRGIVAESLDSDQAERVTHYSRGNAARSMRIAMDRAHARGERVTADLPPLRLLAAPWLLQHHILTRGAPDDAFLTSLVDDVALPLLRSL